MKYPKKMVQTHKSGLRRDIGHRERSCLQKFLRMANSHPQDLVQHGALKFLPKGAFQGSPWRPYFASPPNSLTISGLS
jgi:hypothetical protein